MTPVKLVFQYRFSVISVVLVILRNVVAIWFYTLPPLPTFVALNINKCARSTLMQVVLNAYIRGCPPVREIFNLHVDKPWYNYYDTEIRLFFCFLVLWDHGFHCGTLKLSEGH